METHEKLRVLAGILLIASAITHILQLFFVGFEWHDISAALFGAVYGILGFLLIKFQANKIVTYICIILPVIGGTLGLVRLFTIEIALHGEINWFIVWHVIADAIISPCCTYSFIKLAAYEKLPAIDFISLVLFDITAIIHMLYPIQYGISFVSLGTAVFGAIYFILAVILWIKGLEKNLTIVSLVIIMVGMILAIGTSIIAYTPFFVFFLIMDIILLILRAYILRKL
ncbi:MAG: hypothetical protein EU544_03985 [Promethearchaeota archaeon]|nr:MAG: hypothetical protein EU544_03985 [Candidatus Lokiarchaeota archaeon]